MYRYYCLASFGALALDWNEEHALTRIHLDLPSIQPIVESPEGIQVINDERRVPHFVFKLIQDFQSYFQSGEPLVSIPWNQMSWEGITPFQRKCLEAIVQIPHGQTRSYSWVAMKIRQPKALRAVGQALRRNPFPILIPCHRVVGTDGALVGFMGVRAEGSDEKSQAINLKSFLIQTEYQYLNPVFSFLA